MEGNMSDLTVLRNYTTETDAQVAAAILEANGIPAVVMADNAGGAIPSMSYVFPTRLLVRSEDAAEAEEILGKGEDD
jgi:hypothetical protein